MTCISFSARSATAAALAGLLLGAAQARSVTAGNGGGGGLLTAACEATFSGAAVPDILCDDYVFEGVDSLGQAQALVAAYKAEPNGLLPGYASPGLGYLDNLLANVAGSSNALFDASFQPDGGTLVGSIRLLQRLDDAFVVNLQVVLDGGAGPMPFSGYFFFGAQAQREAGTEFSFRLPDLQYGAPLNIPVVSMYVPAAQAGASAVPEPGGVLLAATALGALWAVGRRGRRAGAGSGPGPAVLTGASA